MIVTLLYTIEPSIGSASMRYVLTTKHERANAFVGENLKVTKLMLMFIAALTWL